MAKILPVRRRKDKNKGLEPNLYPDTRKLASGDTVTYFKYKNPQTGIMTQLGAVTRERANGAARILNARLAVGADLVGKVLGTAGLTWADVLDKFEADYPNWKIWGNRTAHEQRMRLNKFRRDLDKKDFATWSLSELNEYIDGEFAGDGRIKNRQLMIHIYRFAVSKSFCQENLAEKMLTPISDKRRRARLTPELFKAIRTHKECPDWFKCAMDMSLKTLQGRMEISSALKADAKNKRMHFIRNKTKDKTERAYISIIIDDELQAIIDRCNRLPVHGDRLIRRARLRKKKDAGAEWSAVTPRMLTDEFNRLRDLTGMVDGLPDDQKPTYHEIRSLGGRQLRKQLKDKGWPDKRAKEAVNALMGHTSLKMTEHYLAGGDVEWTECQETINISAL